MVGWVTIVIILMGFCCFFTRPVPCDDDEDGDDGDDGDDDAEDEGDDDGD